MNPALETRSKPEVLLYYANETAPDKPGMDNYRQIIYWLYDSGEPDLLEIARQFEFDLTHFPLMVDRDLKAITSLPQTLQQAAGGVIIATNRLAQHGKILVWRPKMSTFTETPISFPQSNNLLSGALLSERTALRAVLVKAQTLFPPSYYRYTLLLKSHGSDEFVLTPRMVIDAKNAGKETVLDIARGRKTPEKQRPGVTKEQFFSLLKEMDRMEFPLVFLESCDSGSKTTHIPHNIRTLFTTAETGGKSYTIDYELLFAQKSTQSVSQLMRVYLTNKQKQLRPYPIVSTWYNRTVNAIISVGLYFVPLVIILLIALARRILRCQSLSKLEP